MWIVSCDFYMVYWIGLYCVLKFVGLSLVFGVNGLGFGYMWAVMLGWIELFLNWAGCLALNGWLWVGLCEMGLFWGSSMLLWWVGYMPYGATNQGSDVNSANECYFFVD